MPDKIHVVVVDDHPLFREGVTQALARHPQIEVAGEGASAEEAVRLVSEILPDVLLLDVDIPGGGLRAADLIASRYPVTKIIMLTVSAQEHHLMAALKAGARAYVLKGVSSRDLINIVLGVFGGEFYVTPGLAAGMLREMSRAQAESRPPAGSPLDELSERERQILEHVAQGLSNKEIGDQLGLSEKTVKHYVTNILQKLQVRNRVEAALLARGETRAVSRT